MKVGADRKRLIALTVLVLVGGYVLYSNVFSGSETSASTSQRPPQIAPAATLIRSEAEPGAGRGRQALNRGGDSFKPYVHDSKHPIDPAKVDPTIRFDLLAKVQNVEIDAATQRNLFQFGEAPRAVPVDNRPLPTVANIAVNGYGPQPVQPPPPPPAPPPPPPITFKYYGFSTPRVIGHKRAFFLDGEDIIVAAEGDLIEKRYKLVKIGVNSVTMEDTQFNHQQTLPLAVDAAT